MSEVALQQPDRPKLPELALTEAGEQAISSAVAKMSLIGRVQNDADNERAVAAQLAGKEIANLLEKARVAAVAAPLEEQRKINAFFKSKIETLSSQIHRIGKMTADYAALVLAKRRAEENARKEELTRLEREREAALAKVDTHEERDAIQTHFDRRAQEESVSPPNPVSSVKGQQIREDWDIVVSDVHLLARAHPSCVKITPLVSEIKSLVKAGVKVAGVVATKKVEAVVRAPSVSKAIDV